MLTFAPGLDISKYIDENGMFTDAGSVLLRKATDDQYLNADFHRKEDTDNHEILTKKINDILASGDEERYLLIGGIIDSYEYSKLSRLFDDINEFKSSYAIYETEKAANIKKSIFDIARSIDEYRTLRMKTLYCFRRIQMKCTDEEIDFYLNDLLSNGCSVFFFAQMLCELELLGNRGYIGEVFAEFYRAYELCKEADFFLNYSQKKFGRDVAEQVKSNELVNVADSYTPKKPHKVCFISCVNDELSYAESLFYISKLIVPKDCAIDTVAITDADSMTMGYNAGMKASDADIKIYLHQDVCIINPFFLYEVIRLFESDACIGIIGFIGSPKLPPDAVMWHGRRIGNLYVKDMKVSSLDDLANEPPKYECVEALDGFMLATSKDIEWREDIFDGWHFYDISQCFEFRKRGYLAVVPEQDDPWAIHDDGLLNLANYNRYRKVFMEEYLR